MVFKLVFVAFITSAQTVCALLWEQSSCPVLDKSLKFIPPSLLLPSLTEKDLFLTWKTIPSDEYQRATAPPGIMSSSEWPRDTLWGAVHGGDASTVPRSQTSLCYLFPVKTEEKSTPTSFECTESSIKGVSCSKLWSHKSRENKSLTCLHSYVEMQWGFKAMTSPAA